MGSVESKNGIHPSHSSHSDNRSSLNRTIMLHDIQQLTTKIKVVNEIGSFTDVYEERSRLGSGSFGQVIKARHYLDKSWYAIKIIHFQAKDMSDVRKEVENYASLPVHNNIVSYKGCWIEKITEINFGLFVRMECCDIDLGSFLRNRNHKFFSEAEYKCKRQDLRYGRNLKSEDKVINQLIMSDIITGLTFLHQREIIHRDLKPGNVLIKFDRLQHRIIIKIADFGLAKHFDVSTNGLNTNCGTVVYAAPEQLFCRKYDKRVDLFPLGLIYFELIYPLEEGQTKLMTLIKTRDEKMVPEKLKKLNKKECELILRLLSEDPNLRPSLEEIRGRINIIKFEEKLIKNMHKAPQSIKNEDSFRDEYLTSVKPVEFRT